MTYNKEILNRFLTEKVAIAVRTSEEWDKFMHLLEAEADVKWLSGDNPTELNHWSGYGDNSTITCGYQQPSKLEFSYTSFFKKRGYEIIEFEELIKGKEKMTPNYRDLFVKTKIGEFFVNKGYFTNFNNYKGYVLAFSSAKQAEYFDFLLEMKGYGIERDEIEQIIIKDYLTEKENDEIEQVTVKYYIIEEESDKD